jgi:hypothetical protein
MLMKTFGVASRYQRMRLVLLLLLRNGWEPIPSTLIHLSWVVITDKPDAVTIYRYLMLLSMLLLATNFQGRNLREVTGGLLPKVLGGIHIPTATGVCWGLDKSWVAQNQTSWAVVCIHKLVVFFHQLVCQVYYS